MMREEHVKNTVNKVCPTFDSRSNQCTQKRENKRRRRQCEEERKKTNEKRERACVLLVARFGLLLFFSTLFFPLIIIVATTTTTQRVCLDERDFLCGMHFFLFLFGQKKCECNNETYETPYNSYSHTQILNPKPSYQIRPQICTLFTLSTLLARAHTTRITKCPSTKSWRVSRLASCTRRRTRWSDGKRQL